MELIESNLPLKVTGVDVKGKFMWWTLEGGGQQYFAWITYGMSGQWSPQQSKHSSFIVEYNGSGEPVTRDTKKIFFNDPRHFGTIKFVSSEGELRAKLKTLGPSILDDVPMTPEIFAERILKKPNRTISEALMDQSCVSGCGNYIKAECLYRSGVSPHRGVTELESNEVVKLHEELLSVAHESYIDQGASIRTYKTVEGGKGEAQFFFRVYNQKECLKKHAVQREETLDGRTSWWCKECQK
jgi:formamidopyrimidine-DNA glycosylase